MAKRIKFKIGDVFLFPLENDLKGVGRVLSIDRATSLIELYHMKPIKDISEYIFNEVIKEKPLIMHWTYDDALRKGLWEIIDNQHVEDEIEMPYFWNQDSGDMKYYIRKGTQDSYRTTGERTEIQKEDIYKYGSFGIGNEISEKIKYMRRLKEAGLMR